MSVESAIPEHLRKERTVKAKKPDNFEPFAPAYTARFSQNVKDLAMVIVGAQHQNKPSDNSSSLPKVFEFLDSVPDPLRPRYKELAAVTDPKGAYNEIVIGYWESRSNYEDWASQSGFDSWWKQLDPANESCGWFLEAFFPPADRFETIFSDNESKEGAAHMRECSSGLIEEHIYWGSMRDRLPVSQIDVLDGEKWSGESTLSNSQNRRIQVPGRQNLAVIRSGQDWSATNSDERKLYVETMHPVLIKGMNFLRDQGEEVGCFSCRLMDVLDKSNKETPTEKTFGLAYFDELASLEGWSKQHKTHLDIFGGFMRYIKEMNYQQSLRLFHEVMVLTPEQQNFEYIGCHDKTGMLASV